MTRAERLKIAGIYRRAAARIPVSGITGNSFCCVLIAEEQGLEPNNNDSDAYRLFKSLYYQDALKQDRPPRDPSYPWWTYCYMEDYVDSDYDQFRVLALLLAAEMCETNTLP